MDENQPLICLVCEEQTPEGLQILGQAICPGCARRLQELEPGDPGYEVIQRQISRFWQRIEQAFQESRI